jgi:hypothetical protein
MPEILNLKMAPPVLLIFVSSHDGDFVPYPVLALVLARGLVVAFLVTPVEPSLSLSQSSSILCRSIEECTLHFIDSNFAFNWEESNAVGLGLSWMPRTHCESLFSGALVSLGCCQGNNREISPGS